MQGVLHQPRIAGLDVVCEIGEEAGKDYRHKNGGCNTRGTTFFKGGLVGGSNTSWQAQLPLMTPEQTAEFVVWFTAHHRQRLG